MQNHVFLWEVVIHGSGLGVVLEKSFFCIISAIHWHELICGLLATVAVLINVMFYHYLNSP